MYRAQWQSPPMPGCPGCAISDHMHPVRTFGLSMAGMSHRDGQSSQKSIHRFGGEALRRRIVTTTNTTHFPLRNGCAALTLTVHSRVYWLPLSRLLSAKQRILRAGYWEFNERRRSRQTLAHDLKRRQRSIDRFLRRFMV